jgi:hypothetical protein
MARDERERWGTVIRARSATQRLPACARELPFLPYYGMTATKGIPIPLNSDNKCRGRDIYCPKAPHH